LLKSGLGLVSLVSQFIINCMLCCEYLTTITEYQHCAFLSYHGVLGFCIADFLLYAMLSLKCHCVKIRWRNCAYKCWYRARSYFKILFLSAVFSLSLLFKSTLKSQFVTQLIDNSITMAVF